MNLKSTLLTSFGLLALLVAIPTISTLSAQEAEPKQEVRGRLPAHWNDIVTEDQKKEIYKIQHGYQAQIKKLELEIAKLEAAMEDEVKSVLTDVQLTRLKELIEEEELRRKKNEAAKEAAKKALSGS
ncbi:hypothetical protein Pan97_09880 [Bremerella volcania]|uniref:LTXXQ motif protein n=1 Tax=Bremerella volcania TaxID=2527984 RepID=A0A518C428_9BACT|nr:hypothetical protein [Bremerella volcania]QDU73988.1 hypothetical protein Pan97_09880 [Bremerella volcania]